MSAEKRESATLYSFNCPSCENGTIDIVKSVYDLPDGDKMLILKFECNNCTFHKNDVIPLTTNMDPGMMTLKVTTEEDLKSKIYRSPVGKLEIPELELIVEPGPSASFYFTNIEGILDRFKGATLIMRRDLEEKSPLIDEIEEVLHDLEKAIEG